MLFFLIQYRFPSFPFLSMKQYDLRSQSHKAPLYETRGGGGRGGGVESTPTAYSLASVWYKTSRATQKSRDTNNVWEVVWRRKNKTKQQQLKTQNWPDRSWHTRATPLGTFGCDSTRRLDSFSRKMWLKKLPITGKDFVFVGFFCCFFFLFLWRWIESWLTGQLFGYLSVRHNV